MTIDELLNRLQGVKPAGEGKWTALCPAHSDENPSLSVGQGRDGRILLHCHGGCPTEKVLEALGLTMSNLFPEKGGGRGVSNPPETRLTGCGGGRKSKRDKTSRPATSPEGGELQVVDRLTVVSPSLRLEELAEDKKLPLEFLAKLGVQTIYLNGRPVVRIPYRDERGEEVAVRFRLALEGETRFKWRKGDKPLPYGLPRLPEARKAGWLLLVEGESDCWTLWHHGLPALGLPGASTWRTEWAGNLRGLEVYLWQEPDDAGAALAERLAHDLPGVKIIRAPEGVKDPSELHRQGRDVKAEIERLKAEAITGEALLAEKKNAELAELAAQAQKVLDDPDPVKLIEEEFKRLGYGGETKFPVIVYLAAVTRLLPIRRGQMGTHLALVGRPSTGKSFTLQRVLDLLPPEAYHVIDAGSPRALIYDETDLRHRVVVFSEADSIPKEEDNPAASAIRSLLQDGQMTYSVVEKNPDGKHRTRIIERPGPSVLITTATRGLGEQLASRLFVLDLPDNPDRLKKILETQAKNELEGATEPDPTLVAFQAYLQRLAPWDVTVPFVEKLAKCLSKNLEPRVLRDHARLLSLVKAVALLRHRHRRRDEQGRLVAEIEDYQTIYELCREMYESTASGCSPAVREVVELVARLREEDDERPVSYSLLAERLGITREGARKRAKVALAAGWLINKETRPGRPADLAPGEPLPEKYSLPAPEEIEAMMAGETVNPATCPQPTPQPGRAEEGGRHDADSEAGVNLSTEKPENIRPPSPPPLHEPEEREMVEDNVPASAEGEAHKKVRVRL